MKRKKMPLWLAVTLWLLLAISCVGSTWLIGAAIADPLLFEEVTAPAVAFWNRSVDAVESQVQKAKLSMEEAAESARDYVQNQKDSVKLYFQEKERQKQEEENLAQELMVELRESQAYQESLLKSPMIADERVTHFETDVMTDTEYLLGGNSALVYFNQMDEQWGSYGSDSIYGYGCGPTSMAMIVSTLTNRYIDPQEMSDIFVQQGFWALKSGTYYTFGHGSAELFGLDILTLVPEETRSSDLIHYLSKGSLIVALVSQGHFTNGGHYIVLRGATLQGEILVADPASRERSLITWDPQLILDELSASRYHGAPLWVFSPKMDSSALLIPEE